MAIMPTVLSNASLPQRHIRRQVRTVWHTRDIYGHAIDIPMHRLFPLLAACLASACSAPADRHEEVLFEAQDHVAEGTFSAGIEGPAVGPDGALYAVNFEREGTIGRVLEDPAGHGRAELFVALPEGSTGNGLRFDAEGHLLVADYTGHAILRIDPASGDVATFASMPADTHQPNDIATAPDGTLYASDPDWAHDGGQLWRIDRDGSVHLLETGMGTTNGIEVSPDGRLLYVNESVQRRIWAYDRLPDGSIAGKRLLIAFDDHGLDGMRADLDGNLHVARYGAGTVAVVAPDGRVLREVRLRGAKPTNVAFGGADGRTVYVTLQDRGAIERYRSDISGREARGARPAAGTPD